MIEAKEPVGQVFMIHGFALSSYSWIPLATQFAENGYTCVMTDLPDFGYSTRETAKTENCRERKLCTH